MSTVHRFTQFILGITPAKAIIFALIFSTSIFLSIFSLESMDHLHENNRQYEAFTNWQTNYPAEYLAWAKYIKFNTGNEPLCGNKEGSGRTIIGTTFYKDYGNYINGEKMACGAWIKNPPLKSTYGDELIKELNDILSSGGKLMFISLVFIVGPGIGVVFLLKILQFAIIESRTRKGWFRTYSSISLIMIPTVLIYSYFFSGEFEGEELVWVWKSIISCMVTFTCFIFARVLYCWIKDGFQESK